MSCNNMCSAKYEDIRKMLKYGAPLSVISETLNVNLSDIMKVY